MLTARAAVRLIEKKKEEVKKEVIEISDGEDIVIPKVLPRVPLGKYPVLTDGPLAVTSNGARVRKAEFADRKPKLAKSRIFPIVAKPLPVELQYVGDMRVRGLISDNDALETAPTKVEHREAKLDLSQLKGPFSLDLMDGITGEDGGVKEDKHSCSDTKEQRLRQRGALTVRCEHLLGVGGKSSPIGVKLWLSRMFGGGLVHGLRALESVVDVAGDTSKAKRDDPVAVCYEMPTRPSPGFGEGHDKVLGKVETAVPSVLRRRVCFCLPVLAKLQAWAALRKRTMALMMTMRVKALSEFKKLGVQHEDVAFLMPGTLMAAMMPSQPEAEALDLMPSGDLAVERRIDAEQAMEGKVPFVASPVWKRPSTWFGLGVDNYSLPKD